MKVALVGSSGYIAEFILKKFKNEPFMQSILKIDCNKDADVYLNLKEPCNFDYSVLDDIDYLIFTAAVSGPDECANNFEHCWKINVEGTCHFISEAINRKCRVLFFSSDAVFNDNPNQVYYEDSITSPITAYGKMKKAVEDEFKNSEFFKAVRLSYVVSQKDRFTTYCLNCLNNDIVADIFHPFYRNAITVSDVVDAVIFFAKNWGEYPHTFLNLAGNELISRIRILDELNFYLKSNIKYKITVPSDDFFKNRSRSTQMSSLYLNKYKIISNETFKEKFAKELEGVKI